MAKVKTIDELKEQENVQYYTFDENVLKSYLSENFSPARQSLEDLINRNNKNTSLSSKEKEASINEAKYNLYKNVINFLDEHKELITESLPGYLNAQDVVACFTDNKGFHFYFVDIQSNPVKLLYFVENDIISPDKINKHTASASPSVSIDSDSSSSEDEFYDALSDIDSDIISDIDSDDEHEEVFYDAVSGIDSNDNLQAKTSKKEHKTLPNPVFVELTEEKINSYFKDLNNSSIGKSESGNYAERINRRTYLFNNEIISQCEPKNIFNKVVSLEEAGNIEKCNIQNNEGTPGIVIQFKHIKSKASQIEIPQKENSSFSGIMSIARLDNDGKELYIYDILRIKEGKVIDIFCAEPKPTLENSRVAEIYEQLNKESSISHKTSKSFVEGISVRSSNSFKSSGPSI